MPRWAKIVLGVVGAVVALIAALVWFVWNHINEQINERKANLAALHISAAISATCPDRDGVLVTVDNRTEKRLKSVNIMLAVTRENHSKSLAQSSVDWTRILGPHEATSECFHVPTFPLAAGRQSVVLTGEARYADFDE